MIHKILFSGISILIFWIATIVSANSTITYEFGYLEADELNIAINLIDVSIETPNIDRIVLPLEGKVVDFRISDNGLWLALLIRDELNDYVYVVDLINFETILVESMPLFSLGSTGVRLAWSPNSNMLAYLGYLQDVEAGVNIFNVKTREKLVVGISFPLVIPYELGWMQQSDSILVAYDHCVYTVETCNTDIQVIDVHSGEVKVSISLGFINAHICRLTPSPDAQYIVFITECRFPGLETFHDVFLLNIQTENLERLTYRTASDFPWNTVEFEGEFTVGFSVVWLNQAIVISTTGGKGAYFSQIFPESFVSETFVYDIAQLSTETVSENYIRFSDVDFESGLYVGISYEDYLDNNIIQSIEKSVDVLDDQFNTILSGPAGCNAHLSPDGKYVAYNAPKSNLPDDNLRCNHSDSLVVINVTTQEIKQIPISADFDKVIGWIAVDSVDDVGTGK